VCLACFDRRPLVRFHPLAHGHGIRRACNTRGKCALPARGGNATKVLQEVQVHSHEHAEGQQTGIPQIDPTPSSSNTQEAPANPAGQTDASIAAPSSSHDTNHTAGQATTASSVTAPVRTRSRRRSTKGNGKSMSTKEKPPSIVGSSEGKQSTKRRKISFFERITFICTSCVTSSPRTHDVDIDEGVSHKDKDVSEKQSTKEVESTTVEHPTREPSAATTSEGSSLTHKPELTWHTISCCPSAPTSRVNCGHRFRHCYWPTIHHERHRSGYSRATYTNHPAPSVGGDRRPYGRGGPATRVDREGAPCCRGAREYQ
jgi:hypothetical protein